MWNYGLSWQQDRAAQDCVCCFMWQHPQPWQGTGAPCKTMCLVFNNVVLQHSQWSALCNSQTSFRACGKSFVFSTLRSRVLIPLRLCGRLLLFSVKLLLQAASPTYSFSLAFNNSNLQRDSPTSSSLSFWQTQQHLQTGHSLLFLLLTIA